MKRHDLSFRSCYSTNVNLNMSTVFLMKHGKLQKWNSAQNISSEYQLLKMKCLELVEIKDNDVVVIIFTVFQAKFIIIVSRLQQCNNIYIKPIIP